MSDVKSWAAEAVDDLAEISNNFTPRQLPNDTTLTNLLIIDGNNLGYRYLKRKNYNSFGDDYIRTIDSLAASYRCKDILVAYDYGKSAYRMGIYPDYKGHRRKDETDEEKEKYKEFFAELDKTAAKLPYPAIKFYGVEADDIISYIINNLHDRYPEVWLISSDRDMYQLLKGNVKIFNLFSRVEITAESLLTEKDITTSEYLLSRIIQGDSGDNIKGIEGIGEVRGQSLAKTYKNLPKLLGSLPIKGTSKYIKALNSGSDILIRNSKLMCLSEHYKEAIVAGVGGEDNLTELNKVIAPMLEYPKIDVPPTPSRKPIPDMGMRLAIAKNKVSLDERY